MIGEAEIDVPLYRKSCRATGKRGGVGEVSEGADWFVLRLCNQNSQYRYFLVPTISWHHIRVGNVVGMIVRVVEQRRELRGGDEATRSKVLQTS